MSELKEDAKKINDLVNEIKIYKTSKEQLLENLKRLDAMRASKQEYDKILKGKSKEDWLKFYNNYILQLLDRIENLNEGIIDSFKPKKIFAKKKKLEAPSPTPTVPTPAKLKATKSKEKIEKEILKPGVKLGKKTKAKYLKELGLDEETIQRFIKPKKEEQLKISREVEYTVYEASSFGKISNSFMEKLTLALTKKFPKFFENLYVALRASDIKLLSKTYVSIVLFSTFLAFLVVTLFSFIGFYFLTKLPLVLNIFRSVVFGILGAAVVFALVYFYPAMVVSKRRREIKDDLPFVIIHMAAVAGSGAQPISMFNLILSSEEYKGLEAEIKKIVNYVNLFGYDLSTALRAVASTTPSPDFRELLNGIVSTVETGGSLKAYLKEKAADAMTTYGLERKKYVETLSTYSDIYTGVLIAAPLLFIVTLAIINVLGGRIGPLSVRTLATFGIFLIIPFLNIAFILFLNRIQPGV